MGYQDGGKLFVFYIPFKPYVCKTTLASTSENDGKQNALAAPKYRAVLTVKPEYKMLLATAFGPRNIRQ